MTQAYRTCRFLLSTGRNEPLWQYADAGYIEADGKDEGKPSALAKLEGRISDTPEAAAPDAFALKVEETRLPPVP